MRCADRFMRWLGALAAVTLVSCGGGNSSVTTLSGGGLDTGTAAATATLSTPTGPNTTEVRVDQGPASGFSFGVANIPYVTVTVCAPNSASTCVTIDHVFLDTGSIGLRVLKSSVASLGLPPVTLPADAKRGTPAGTAVECYPFVLGGVWGALAKADVSIAAEQARGIPIQVIDDSPSAPLAPTDDCVKASHGTLLNSMGSLQAKAILGIGMLGFDCGLVCYLGDYAGGHIQYYVCPDTQNNNCVAAAVPIELQIQNPVVHFAVNNNGTIISLPSVPDLGAGVATGRLVFGIGTQANNQISPTAKIYQVDANPASPSYLYLSTTMGTSTFAESYIDSGSNAFFFDDKTIHQSCQSSAGATEGGWYCPATLLKRTATLTDSAGSSGTIDFSVANADALFSTPSTAFANLAGSVNQGPQTFVWGLSFFYGRTVYTSIWGQALSSNGPWNAF